MSPRGSSSLSPSFELCFRKNALSRPQPNTIVGRHEVEISRAVLSRRHTHHPLIQISGSPERERMEHERWQRKVINPMRLVRISEVREFSRFGRFVSVIKIASGARLATKVRNKRMIS